MVLDNNKKVFCKTCGNTRRVVRFSVVDARAYFEPCPECHGVGPKRQSAETSDGVKVLPHNGILHYFYYVFNEQQVASVQTIIEGVQLQEKRYMVVSILNMTTDREYRRRGYMKKLIDKIKNLHNGEVKYIFTSWDNSKEYSRGYLQRQGFRREGTHLIWRRDKNGTELVSRKNPVG